MNTALLSAEAAHDDTLDKVRLLEKVRIEREASNMRDVYDFLAQLRPVG